MPEACRQAIVTGAASGIGRALVIALRANGVAVTGLDRAPSDTTDVAVDLCTSDLARLASDLPAWDMLFHAAGLAADAPPPLILGVNAVAPRLLTGALAPSAREGAAVLAISSIAAHLTTFSAQLLARAARLAPEAVDAFVKEQALDGPTAYRLSKRMLRDWARAQAAGKDPIRVNTVSPGPVRTPLWERARAASPRAGESFLKLVPHVPAPAEIAPAMIALCSPAFFWVNGVDVPLDGGLAARLIQESE